MFTSTISAVVRSTTRHFECFEPRVVRAPRRARLRDTTKGTENLPATADWLHHRGGDADRARPELLAEAFQSAVEEHPDEEA